MLALGYGHVPTAEKHLSSYRDHLYAHRENQYECRQCNNEFPFLSRVRNHWRAHLNQRLFKCFAGGCKSSFKHPQDLHHHIAKHIGKQFTCEKCGHTTYQARLLKRHQVVHQNKQKHKCSLCRFKSKYWWSLDGHLKRHKWGYSITAVKDMLLQLITVHTNYQILTEDISNNRLTPPHYLLMAPLLVKSKIKLTLSIVTLSDTMLQFCLCY